MPLTPGTPLGPYEITGAIGAGGMGEVFRARDTKLNRDVAIKVLPAAFADDPERLARFTREAQTLASLNHPNIATIYGIEELPAANGSAASRALVMELVDGEDLSIQMARGPIPIAEALPIARQIAEALEAAHEQGIVHRDLKPANIKVRADGTVKVLDFGLAKAMDPAGGASSNPNVSHSPTLTHQGTSAGMIIGTAAYMSPEQAKGKPVDKRSDIWAFGVVLYEMLTGKRAFKGEDVSETLASVLKDTLSMDALPATVPPRLKRLIERCLDRDLKSRLRDIGEARVKIARIEAGFPESDASTPPNPPAAHTSLWWRALPWGLSAALALSLLVVARRQEPVERETRLEITMPEGGSDQFALAPDGQSLVFRAADRLWLRRFDRVEAQPLPGTEGAGSPFWSPDSRSIAFSSQTTLSRFDLSSGTPRIIADGIIAFAGGTWNKNDVILFGMKRQLFRVPASGGTPVSVARPQGKEDSRRRPRFLPDGRRFLYLVPGTAGERGLYMGSLDDDRIVHVGDADTTAIPVPPDRVAFVRGGALIVQKFDPERGALLGEGDVVATQVGYTSALGGDGAFSVSETGRLAYRTGGATLSQLTRFDRSGKPLAQLSDAESTNLQAPVISPDGRRIAVDRTFGGNRDVWLVDLAHGAMSRFTFDSKIDGYPVWSPDGSRIAFESSREGPMDIYVRPADSSAPEEPLLKAPGNQWPQDWSKDGRFLLYFEADLHNGDLLALPLTGSDRTPIPVATSEFNERRGAFSPDGRWVAYDTNESGRYEVVVQSFPENSGKWQVSTAGGTSPRWSRDGREIYFVGPDSKLMAAPVRSSGRAFEAGTPLALFQTTIPTEGLRAYQDAAADGTFVIAHNASPATNSPVVIVMNWKPGAK